MAEEESRGFEAEIHLTNGSVVVGRVIESDAEFVRVELVDCVSDPPVLPVALIDRRYRSDDAAEL